MDGPAFCRLAHAILIREGKPTPTGRLYVDGTVSISMTQSLTPEKHLQVLEIIKRPTEKEGAKIVTVMTRESILAHDDRHRSVEPHLIALARKHGLTVRGVSDKLDGLVALEVRAARIAGGNRELDAALWWLYADHAETGADDLAEVEKTGAAAYLDRSIGASIWRDGAKCTMVPRLSSSLDALRTFIRDALPGWGCEWIEPGGDCAPDARPSATMWYGGRAVGPQAAPTLELAAFRVTLGALLVHESRFPGDA